MKRWCSRSSTARAHRPRCSQQHIHRAPRHLWFWRVGRTWMLNGRAALPNEEVGEAVAAVWGTGEFQHMMNPDMPWNEEIRATWARMERLAASPGTITLIIPLVNEMDVRAVLPTV